MDNPGATIWARATLDSDIFMWKPDKWFKIWFFLICKASHKDGKQFKRGELHTSGTEISNATKASPDQVKKCLIWLRKERMIDTKRSTRGTRIKLLTYDKYQRLDNYASTKQAREKHERSTTINKNDKNDKYKYSNNFIKVLKHEVGEECETHGVYQCGGCN